MLRGSVVARRVAVRGYDFAKAAGKLSSPAARSELAALASAHADALSKLKATEAPVAPIDWAYYRESIKSNKTIVSEFEKNYTESVFPTYVSDMKGKVDAEMNMLIAEAQAAEENSSKRAAELMAMLKDLEDNRIDRLTTVDEYAARNTDVDTEAMDEIKKGQYYA
jgi:hypothetical protein